METIFCCFEIPQIKKLFGEIVQVANSESFKNLHIDMVDSWGSPETFWLHFILLFDMLALLFEELLSGI
jgi:hypothetical protein